MNEANNDKYANKTNVFIMRNIVTEIRQRRRVMLIETS